MKNRGLEMSFTWLFGIVIGIIILSFAIFAVTKIISQGEGLQDAKTSKEIGILLNPLETSFETSKTSSFTMPVETRISVVCDNLTGTFGRQLISTSQKSFNKWTKTNLQVSFPNKYLFAERELEGKKFYVFSKPFEFPFKVADVIYLTSADENYCFEEMGEDLKRELKNLNQENIFVEEEEFPEECISVCFSSNDCNVKVNEISSFVEKNNKKMYFDGEALMFAAIFSDYENYECGIDRLIMKTKKLAEIYEEKSKITAVANCNSNVNLLGFISSLENFESSSNILGVADDMRDLGSSNKIAECKLW